MILGCRAIHGFAGSDAVGVVGINSGNGLRKQNYSLAKAIWSYCCLIEYVYNNDKLIL